MVILLQVFQQAGRNDEDGVRIKPGFPNLILAAAGPGFLESDPNNLILAILKHSIFL